MMTQIIYFMFFLLFSFCITGAVYDATWIKNNFNKHWYLGPNYTNTQYDSNNPALNGLANFITCFILYGEDDAQCAAEFDPSVPLTCT